MQIRLDGRLARRVGLMAMAAVLVGGSPAAPAAETAPPPRTNIVLIMADDFGRECVGCYGGTAYKTPNLDRMAAGGARFTRAYAQPLCTPSRAQIMTGRYNHRNYEAFGYLNPKEITFANLLRDAGYKTCIAGKWQLTGDAETVRGFGFDEHCLWNMAFVGMHEGDRNARPPRSERQRYWAPTLYVNGQWVEHGPDRYGPDVCCEFILSFIERNRAAPFLVYYPMILTHDPFDPTPDSADRNSKNRARNFGDMVAYADKLVGRIAGRLEQLGLRDRTLILFTGDNGTHKSITTMTADGPVRGGKGSMTDAGTHVPLIAYGASVAPAGAVYHDLVDFTDVLPTLVEVTGAALPANRVLDGRSFAPRLRGEPGNPRSWVFCHYWGNGRSKAGAREFMRDRQWKLYDDGKLYDLERDPFEQRPVTGSGGAADGARRRLEAAYKEISR